MDSPNPVTISIQPKYFDRIPSESLGFLLQYPIMLGGKFVLVYFMVIEGPLEFNTLLWHDYVYAINVVFSILFCVMHFPHNRSIVTNDQIAYVDPPHYLNLDQAFPLSVPSIWVDTSLPWVKLCGIISFVSNCY